MLLHYNAQAERLFQFSNQLLKAVEGALLPNESTVSLGVASGGASIRCLWGFPQLGVKPPRLLLGTMSRCNPLYACVSADGLEVFAAKLEKAAKEQKRLK